MEVMTQQDGLFFVKILFLNAIFTTSVCYREAAAAHRQTTFNQTLHVNDTPQMVLAAPIVMRRV